ncbi:hypothetical protein JH06_5023 [Blastocystis sp. subtype 4]|uniref:hypothetical protein n=1 Tax=Blastocystis sp. subtype 4 TaxID=944170 RepID=UPI0007119DCF|nr:hypothetical protein JH06_5023 [Blastocystis sp. subtype 4]KNB41559.1 hypothetical protein JH06_5023 [Blastocystis sp. subtype 4]|eukprot:XP_014525002.1 hypothetical protein JH06_5023 [Blastocystis sp. subtype 4]
MFTGNIPNERLGFPQDSFLADFQVSSVEIENDDGSKTGKATVHISYQSSNYEMLVNMKDGKKEGDGLILYANGTLFMKLKFVNDLAEGIVLKKEQNGRTILRGELEHGKECSVFEEYDSSRNVTWRGFYQNGKRYRELKKKEGMDGFYSEANVNGGELLSVSEYDDRWRKNGRCFEGESGRLKRECLYENGVKKKLIREFTGSGVAGYGLNLPNNTGFGNPNTGFGNRYNNPYPSCNMIEYDENGVRVYEGGFEGDIIKGFVRAKSGTEYESDGKRALYYGDWKNGKREGKGSEFKDLNLVYIGEWKDGMRDGNGEEYNENDELVRSGRWIKGEYGVLRYKNDYGNDLNSFSATWLNGIERVEIGNDCFKEVSQFVLEGLNTLRSVKIGKNSFYLNGRREGSKCVIRNCDQLRQIHFGDYSFRWYDSFELKNLPLLKSIQLDMSTFGMCHSVVFESMND